HELALTGNLSDADDVATVRRKVGVLKPLIPSQLTHFAGLTIQRIQVAVETDVSMQLLLIEDDGVFRNTHRRTKVPQGHLALPGPVDSHRLDGGKAVRISYRI